MGRETAEAGASRAELRQFEDMVREQPLADLAGFEEYLQKTTPATFIRLLKHG